MNERQWFSGELKWMSLDKGTKTWISDPPNLPEWVLPPGNGVPAEQFIRIWQSSETLGDVKKELFWCSLEEIEEQRESINSFLAESGYQTLGGLSLASVTILSKDQLLQLEHQGLIRRTKDETVKKKTEESDYDAARAIFDAVPDNSYDPHSHIASVEVHGGRFTGKH
jgi:hypothetical protein